MIKTLKLTNELSKVFIDTLKHEIQKRKAINFIQYDYYNFGTLYVKSQWFAIYL